MKDPDIEIRGMAEYHVRLVLGAATPFVDAREPGPGEPGHIFEAQQRRFGLLTQVVEDCIREAYFRGATYGLSLASTTKYMVVTAEQMAAINERIEDEGSGDATPA